jgi:hypothetical protein
MVLGSVATDPKAWLEPEGVAREEIENTISQLTEAGALSVHGMSKLAYCETKRSNVVFANGHSLQVTANELLIFRDICKFRTTSGSALCENVGAKLQQWLLTSGVFDLTALPG